MTVIKYTVWLSFFFYKNDIRHTSDESQNLFGIINFKVRLSFDLTKLIIICELLIRELKKVTKNVLIYSLTNMAKEMLGVLGERTTRKLIRTIPLDGGNWLGIWSSLFNWLYRI